jgi:hypothetical protein
VCKLRLAFIAGSEERWFHDHGRPMTADELVRVLRRYPGDPPSLARGRRPLPVD